ncbi:LacI family DNA-binding transcriptional regulator [Actinacidiphila epipremni]|jgi:DNA-binding LacI/PurR family transcriptional regulator|uniref:LacI family transcriptional regulator n=1 Tax=Actinacidiphila epipremni TaxID=2053013 RepID=A0ABX0ZUK3_9ACTN|nr:LacI family DNA-binding transcriptional regulator [Actinacidiphila epipremni]NJP46462.1 LacI family transcriptional regulator [Actinacidiphila epipremni]
MAVTIADVARQAGVSRSTVSYVLSGNRSISAETSQRVEQAIRELGFTPHAGARSIRTRRTGVIAMALPMVHGPHNQVQMPYVWAAMTQAQEAGLKLLMLTADDDGAAIRDVVAASLVDGVMLMEVQEEDPRVALLGESGCTAVVVGSPDRAHGLPRVDFDFATMAQELADHLLELGHRAVGYLGQTPEVFERRAAYASHARDEVLAALDKRGQRSAWASCDGSPAGVEQSLAALLEQLPDMSGLIVYNERALRPAMDRLAAMGRRIPEDLSVIALCTDEEAERTTPPVTSLSLPAEELARLAVRSLAGMIASRPVPARQLLAPTWTERASTAPAPG